MKRLTVVQSVEFTIIVGDDFDITELDKEIDKFEVEDVIDHYPIVVKNTEEL